MKPHLPLTLLLTLPGSLVSHAIEIPDGYEQIDLWTASYLDDYTTNTADDKNAFILWTDVAFTPTTNPTWTSSKPLVTGGNLIFTTVEGYDPVALSFGGGQSTVFEQPASLTFDTLSNLTISNQTSSNSGGAIALGTTGKLYIHNVNDGIDSADVIFSNNDFSNGRGSAIYADGRETVIDISDNGDVVFSRKRHYDSSEYTIYGGAIYSDGAININNNADVTFSENYAAEGGAIYINWFGVLNINNNADVTFNGNFSTIKVGTYSYNTYGGAIYSRNEVNINNNSNVTFSENRSYSKYSSYDTCSDGGAIYSEVSLNINNNANVIFSENRSTAPTSKYDSYSYGGAISSHDGTRENATLNINDNADVTFSKNFADSGSYSYGGAIYSEGVININDNTNVTFSDNYSTSKKNADGGAIYSTDTLNINNNANVTFNRNYAIGEYSTYGGAIYSDGTININNNVDVTFCENRSSYGGAIYSTSLLNINNNVDVTFSKNNSRGAIYSKGEVNINKNADVTFSRNLSDSSSAAIYSKEAIYINNNANVTFSGNSSSYEYSSNGGAISSSGTISINNNADVTFSGNSASSTGLSASTYTYTHGGAIYALGALNINNNADITFSGNSATSNTYPSYGGAISIGSKGVLNINNNADVTFSGNSATNADSHSSCGGAIYAEHDNSITIAGNDSVTFEKNYEKTGSSYILRSIYMAYGCDELKLAAKTGGHITFNDSVCIGATASFNADYEDEDGVTQKAGGDIIFSGKYSAEHLAEVKGSAATSDEITTSQTSVIKRELTLYGGSLQVVDGAKLNVYYLTVAADSGAKLLLRNGCINPASSSSHLSLGSGTTLELQGLNTITSSMVTLDGDSAMTVTLDKDNLNTAALALSETKLHTEKLTINLNLTDGMVGGRYKIISLSSATYFGTIGYWTEDNVTVNGGGDATLATFRDLLWENGVLYYIEAGRGRTIWGNGSGDNLWNTTSDNWTILDQSYTYQDGMRVTFSDLGSGEVKLVGDVAPADIAVNNSEGNDYTFTTAEGGGKLVGETGITKNGTGALTIDTANTHTGATVLYAGTLNVHHSNALGATATATTATVTTAEGTTLTVDNKSHVILAAENDMKGAVSVAEGSTLEMRNKGYAAESSSVDGTLHFKGDAASTANSGTLSGTGTVKVENSGVSFTMLKSFTGNMAVEGAAARLTIGSGNYSAAGKISVNGAGATLDMSSSNITMRSGGTLALSSDGEAAVLQANIISIAAGATLSVENLTATEVAPELPTPITMSTGTGGFDPSLAFNTAQSGVIEGKLLTLQQGAIYEALGGNIGLNGGELTLAITPVATQKIEIILTLGAGYTEDSQVVLFTDVNTVNFIFDGTTAKASDNLVYEFNADDYFEGDWINEATKLKYDAANMVVYVENVNDVIPEPTSATLSLLALVGFAARRRRK